MDARNSDRSTSDPIAEDVHIGRPSDTCKRTYGKRHSTIHYRISSKRLSRRKSRINKR